MTFYPGKFVWRHINDEWLVSKAASAVFAFCSTEIVVLNVVLLSSVPIKNSGLLSSIFWAVFGVLGAASIVFLWGGMWRYWMGCDPSSKLARRVSFIVLLIGFWYGAVIYYTFVYLPTIRTARSRGTVR